MVPKRCPVRAGGNEFGEDKGSSEAAQLGGGTCRHWWRRESGAAKGMRKLRKPLSGGWGVGR